jgi:diguanylate cyclase (GGDEF)-like protein
MDLGGFQIPLPLSLALVATLGYLFGRRRRLHESDPAAHSRRELRRAQQVAADLEKTAAAIRQSLAVHHASVKRFRNRLTALGDQKSDAAFRELCREVEEVLKPTLRLAMQVSNAYDEIRQQSANLMTFTEVRCDPLTGVHNRRGFDDALAAQFALMNRYDSRFSLVLFDVDHFKRVNDEHGHLQGDRKLQELAKLIDEAARETDIVARYGGEEFVVVMPQTDLPGACVFAERLRAAVEEQIKLTVSGGVATALDGDNAESLMARADQALYAAKAAGRNRVFRHDGELPEAVVAPAATATADA